MTMGFCPARSTQMTASMTSWPSCSLLLFDLHRDAVGHFLDELHGELLADGLGDLEVDRRDRCAARAETAPAIPAGAQLMTSMRRSRLTPFSADTGTMSRKHVSPASSAVNGSSWSFGIDQVDLVDDGDRLAARIADALEHGLVFLVEAQRLDHEHDQVRIGQRGGGGAVHGAIERALLAEVQAGRVDEGDLHAGPVEHAEDAMARGLRPRGDDGEFLADERIEQRRLADVGTADERGEAGAECDGVQIIGASDM